MTSYAYIVWKDFYSVGHPELDAQHKKIIDFINQLYVAVQEGTENRATKDVLDRLIQYTVDHFNREEAVMREVGYAHLDAHKARHAHMRQWTFDLRTHLKLVTAGDLLHFLKNWWIEHIQAEDKSYAPHLHAVTPR